MQKLGSDSWKSVYSSIFYLHTPATDHTIQPQAFPTKDKKMNDIQNNKVNYTLRNYLSLDTFSIVIVFFSIVIHNNIYALSQLYIYYNKFISLARIVYLLYEGVGWVKLKKGFAGNDA